jgi:putative ABC transport system permease protein
MLVLSWLRGLARMRAGRLLGVAAGVAVAVALLAALGGFLAASKATMTTRSIDRVAVDWQVAAAPGADRATVLRTVGADPRVATALPVDFGTATGLRHVAADTTSSTGTATVLGLPSSYAATFPAQLRYLTGRPDGVLLFQQTAANLRAVPGDKITVGRPGLPPVTLTVGGIVDLPQADTLFQKVGAAPGTQPSAPPDNVVLLPDNQWHPIFDPVAAARPDLIGLQVHVRTHHDLPSDPAAAYTQATASAHHLDAALAGSGVVGDNLGAALGAARGDASYAQVLFLFLGLPGAALAAVLTAVLAGGGADRRRGEQALLRTRGASTSQLLRLAVAEALAVGVTGSVVGLALAALIGRSAFGSSAFGATTAAAIGWPLAAAVIGVAIAVLTVFLPARHDLRHRTVAVAGSAGTDRSPRWMRYGVDVWLLAGAGLVWWATSNSGYQLVLAPEGVPQISVNYWAFGAPGLLWLGAALLTVRLVTLLLRGGRPLLTRALRPMAGRLAGTVAAMLSRQHRLISRTVVLLALTAAFATSTAVFDATYRQQAEADAQLTNGADVTVTEPLAAAHATDPTRTIAAVPGVRSVTAMRHRYAYVGPDLQDIYGIQPATFGATVHLSDAYFAGGTANEMLARLSSRPDSLLVSQETVKDFQLSPGDTLRLRLVDGGTGRRITVPFHYAGVVKEFPTAPKDSFLIANADYLARRTGNAAADTFLVTTDGTAPPAVAARLRSALGAGPTVTDIQTTRTVIGSSLTSVDLSGLSKVELGFALALAAAAAGVQLLLGFAERRRVFALARLLGARRRQLATLVWAEISVVAVAGVAIGILISWALSELLVKILTGVFDPPPDTLAVPWGYLGVVAALTVLGMLVAALRTVAAARRSALEVLRDL